MIGNMDSTILSDEQQSPTTTTSFLLSNLHCPSCVSNIENTLYGLSPKPTSVQPSVVTSWVTVTHTPDLHVTSIQRALEEAGFEVCSITENGIARDVAKRRGEPEASPDFGAIDELFSQSDCCPRKGRGDDSERLRLRHVQDCELCKKTGYRSTKPHRMLSVSMSNQPLLRHATGHPDGAVDEMVPTPSFQQPFVVTEGGDGAEARRDIWKVNVAIGGMTCASCANAITQELKKKDWVRDVTVNLLSNSATVEVVGKHNVEEVISAIEELGYEGVLNSISELDTSKLDTWRASIMIGGMTCASCSNSITTALQSKHWVRDITVNLVTNSASVDFSGKDHLKDITDAIEDLGYEAALDSLKEFGQIPKASQRRTVEIQVLDMFCSHCPGNIVQALEYFGTAIRIEKPLTLKDPILKVSYVPLLPNFTVRDIVSTISGLNSKFHVSIYHPPTLEERSRALHAQQQQRLLLRILFTIGIAIPTFIIGIVFMSLIPSSHPIRKWVMEPWAANVSRAQWILFFLSTPVYFLAADVFHRRAIKEIQSLWRRGNKTPILQRFYRFGSMNMLMSLGTSIAYWSSVAQLIAAGVTKPEMVDNRNFYFDSVVFLTMFLLIGRYIEAYTKSRTGDAVSLLGKLRPTEAILVDTQNGEILQVSVDLIEYGDTVRVLHGASPPCDGTITEGEAVFDESSLTGESKLVKKQLGDEVFSGTINKGAPISIVITGVAGASMLDQIVKAVREGQTKRAPIERIADTLTAYFVPAITFLAIIDWIIWLSLGLSGKLPDDYLDIHDGQGGWVPWSLQFAIAVFVVACPCGLALAAPTALFVGGGLAAQHGILVKGGGEAFEKASKLDCIVFDKTGTLTMGGEPEVTEYLPIPVVGIHQPLLAERILLAMINQIESSSSHTVAKAIVKFCRMQDTEKANITEVEEIPGRGMRGLALYNDKVTELLIGNEALMQDFGIEVPETAQRILETWKREGNSIVLAGFSSTYPVDDSVATEARRSHLAAMFAIADPIRAEAPFVVRALKERGIDVWMLSGDNAITAHAVGLNVGIVPSNIIAGVLPAEKADRIRDLQRSLQSERGDGRAIVAMVGDGINDSPALTTADVGIAIGSGSDIAISAAEFVLVGSNLQSLITLADLSHTVFRRVKFNFGWALVYNLIAVPVAAGAFYAIRTPGGEHVRLDPVWASLAMALSSISVVLSSLALRWGIPGIGFRKREIKMGFQDRPHVRGW